MRILAWKIDTLKPDANASTSTNAATIRCTFALSTSPSKSMSPSSVVMQNSAAADVLASHVNGRPGGASANMVCEGLARCEPLEMFSRAYANKRHRRRSNAAEPCRMAAIPPMRMKSTLCSTSEDDLREITAIGFCSQLFACSSQLFNHLSKRANVFRAPLSKVSFQFSRSKLAGKSTSSIRSHDRVDVLSN